MFVGNKYCSEKDIIKEMLNFSETGYEAIAGDWKVWLSDGYSVAVSFCRPLVAASVQVKR